jgi:hypothetical protein
LVSFLVSVTVVVAFADDAVLVLAVVVFAVIIFAILVAVPDLVVVVAGLVRTPIFKVSFTVKLVMASAASQVRRCLSDANSCETCSQKSFFFIP